MAKLAARAYRVRFQMEIVGESPAAPAWPELDVQRVGSDARRVFGVKDVRKFQVDAALYLAQRRDLAVVAATGTGKSLAFQLGGLSLRCVTIVLVPLIAIRDNQRDQLRVLGVPVFTLETGQPLDAEAILAAAAVPGCTTFIYVTPESFVTGPAIALWEELQRRGLLGSFVVDEAHCCLPWGIEFRPAYQLAVQLLVKMRNAHASPASLPPICICSATLPFAERLKLSNALGLRNPALVVELSDNPLVRYDLLPYASASEKLRQAAVLFKTEVLSQHPDALALISVPSCEESCEVATQLVQRQQLRALPYHATGMSLEDRHSMLQLFMGSGPGICVCTLALGLGWNEPRVRCCFHMVAPDSATSYTQTSGRAARGPGWALRAMFQSSPFDSLKLLTMAYPAERSKAGQATEFDPAAHRTERIRSLFQFHAHCLDLCVCFRFSLAKVSPAVCCICGHGPRALYFVTWL